MSMNPEAAIDAKHDYEVEINTKASSRACRHLKLRAPDDCYGARLIKFTDGNVEWVVVWLTVTYIKFRDQPVPWKFENSKEMRKIAEINDLEGKRGMLQALRIIHSLLEMIGKMSIKLYIPRKGISFERTRSQEYKERKKAWASNGGHIVGRKKKKYTSPKSVGLRCGTGQEHWVDQRAI